MIESLSRTQFALMITLFAVIGISFIIGIFVSIKKKEYSKIIYLTGTVTSICLLIALLVVSIIEKYEGDPVISDIWSEFGLYILTVSLIALICIFAFLIGKKQQCNNTKSIVYAGVTIAASFALSYIRLFELPQGGSVTLASLLPIMIYSYIFGIRKGILVGVIYGFLQFIQAPWFYHPMQFLLDYPIAFATVGICAVFREKNILTNKNPLQFALGALIAVVIRYLSHVVSGIFVFGSGDPENYGAVAWSFLYNAFTFADMAITIAVGVALLSSKAIIRLIENIKN